MLSQNSSDRLSMLARSAVLAAVALAFVAFLASIIALFLMRPPDFEVAWASCPCRK
jgi:hypothetical protein